MQQYWIRVRKKSSGNKVLPGLRISPAATPYGSIAKKRASPHGSLQAGLPAIEGCFDLSHHHLPKVRCIIQTAMNFRNLFVSLFLILAIGLALVQADEAKQPRGPKITSKVIYSVIDCRACIGKNIS